MGLLYHSTADNRSVLEHILEVDKITVMHMLSEVIRIVEVDETLLVCLNYDLGKKYSFGNILGDLTCHIVTLHAVDRRILVGVLLLYFLVITFYKPTS